MTVASTIGRHPIHPMLVTLPIGLWVFSFICDIVFIATADPRWDLVAFYTLAGGEAGALAAAIPGLNDYFHLERPARKIAAWHMSLNLLLVAIVAINLWARWELAAESFTPYVLSAISVVLLVVSGWLGGRLVHEIGVTLPVPPSDQKS